MPGSNRVNCVGVILGVALSCSGPGRADPPPYPPTRVDNVVDSYHGVRVVDPYRWLEPDDDSEVIAWTAQQNALTRELLDAFAEPRARLAAQLEALYAPDVASPPRVHADRYFFTRRPPGGNQPVLYMRVGDLAGEDRMVVDPTEFGADGTVALDWWYPSPDGTLVAYGRSAHGSERSTLYLRDVDSAADLALVIPHTQHASIAWDPDGHGFLYTRFPAPGTVPSGEEHYHRRVYHHRFGTTWEQDPCVWGTGAPREHWPEVYNSSDDRYQFLLVERDWTANDLYVRPAGGAEFTPVAVGLDALVRGDVLGDRLILLTNHLAPRYRIVAAALDAAGPEAWVDVVPEQKGVISDFAVVDGTLVVNVMENAYARLRLVEPDGKLLKEIELPTLGSVGAIEGRPDQKDLFFRFESFAYPPVVYHYDLRAHTMVPFDRLAVEVDLDRYTTAQIWFNSRDGTRVPMFVTHRKDLTLDGHAPAVLFGYGGFNVSLTPAFRRAILPWLDAGGVWAVANLRGGGEFGREWHVAGQRERKQNVFDDFIAAAEKLVADNYTRPERLGALGGSNGGLLAGAMIVQRPDLFRAVVSAVPLLDLLRFPRFAGGRYYASELGDPDDPADFQFLRAYSPYHAVTAGQAYPAVLLTSAAHDSRVAPMHARKMAARLQAASTADLPILLWIEPQAGHSAGKPLDRQLAEYVDVWTFLMWQLGVLSEPTATRPTSAPVP